MRYRLDVAYHGRDFHGWQRQPDLRTVQGELETWVGRFLGHDPPPAIIGAGRTDAGVHAERMPAHFDWPHVIDTESFARRLRVAMPHDLALQQLHHVSDGFHARYSAKSRRYSYQIHLGANPFGRDRRWEIYRALDRSALETCAARILGKHDFSGFCRSASRRENNRCEVSESSWRFEDRLFTYSICADRFLHEMVRLLVGTYVAAASGRWGPDRVSEILRTGDVRLCGDTAPAHGLTLTEVAYPPGVGEAIDFD